MNTMEITKIVAGLCAALLIFLVVQSGSHTLYAVGGGHGDDHGDAYPIEVASSGEAEPEEEVVEVAFADLYAAADPAAGESLWRACRTCHALEPGRNGTGPYLHGVVGRDIAAADGFGYSDALTGAEGAWDPETLSAFIEDPRGWAPGTRMAYNGMPDAEDRANLIAYIATFQ
ncbi:MAG: cytochrome c family protein [Pseudomonadota bacterium]